MVPDKTLEEKYQVGEGVISLSVAVGNAQFGGIDVRFAGESQPLARQDNMLRVDLGKGADIVNRDVVVRTVATDINPFTNKMIVTNVLTGGVQNQVFAMEKEVGEKGDVVYFKAVFHLVG
jgi:hypothetical protein